MKKPLLILKVNSGYNQKQDFSLIMYNGISCRRRRFYFMSHLTEENRKTISSMITHNNTCVDIAEAIGCDPTTIAKEIKKK